MGALTTDRKAAAMAQALGSNRLSSCDGCPPTSRRRSPSTLMPLSMNARILSTSSSVSIRALGALIDAGGLTDGGGGGVADAVDVGECDDKTLLTGNVDSCDTCHRSALPLLVTRVLDR